ncbi:MAG: undecaprenyl/decaprenyl-phosphate alpha-N-acetylglucosaminyl 1-phosphate transferase [Candidatus Polarisedimenticolaceae bacterium]|nr:undecaprenyl/decaprenyl-phosphate alpha-N-acetylglucosaminyl 1-phosphate transferase [Candidatus Polarisedimenticolaceae bacterium]
MQALFALITAMVISMVVLPLMVRLSPYIGMIDQPSARKVHCTPIARVGGVGIVLGALVPLLIWMPMTDQLCAYVMGSIVLFGFGALDDQRELDHYVKFIGQFIAVGIVVFYGGLSIDRIPFVTETLPPSIAIPFTFFAMVGVINAINHSDGLDGLAGGESLLTLLGILFIAYQAGESINQVVVIACAVMGGVIGFLRYNTYPAKVFMGDSGSQFLGFTLAFLVIILTQQINTALSPALPALLLGLPVIDILAVLFLRAKGGMNIFHATRNHIHHRLLDLGFSHQASVVAIYSTQAFFVLSALALTYEADWIILMLYSLVCGAIFILLTQAEQRGWRRPSKEYAATMLPSNPVDQEQGLLSKAGTCQFLFLQIMIPFLLIYVAVAIPSVSSDFAIISALLVVVLALDLFFGRAGRSIIQQGSVFICAIFMVYLSTLHLPESMGGIEVVIYSLLAGSIAVTLKLTKGLGFKTTSADCLTLFIVLLVGFFQDIHLLGVNLTEIALKSAIVLYGCELISNQNTAQRNILNSAVLCVFGILALRWIL